MNTHCAHAILQLFLYMVTYSVITPPNVRLPRMRLRAASYDEQPPCAIAAEYLRDQ
jgi:hypothetical protein